MNPDIKAQWVEALRSGEFKQGKGVLQRSDGKFCCLGVLCELAARAGVIESPTIFDGSYIYASEGAYLPIEVSTWAGLSDNYSPRNPRIANIVSLAKRNDEGLPFSEIADLIEGQL